MNKKVIQLLSLTLLIGLILLAVSPSKVSAETTAVDNIISPPNPSFEYWSTQNGLYSPNNWIVTANNPSKAVVKSTDSFDGTYSLELKGTEDLSGKERSVASTIQSVPFNAKGDSAQNQIQFSFDAKSANPNKNIDGYITIYDYYGNPLGQTSFEIKKGTTSWTRKYLGITLKPEFFFSFRKLEVSITNLTQTPVLLDNLFISQLQAIH